MEASVVSAPSAYYASTQMSRHAIDPAYYEIDMEWDNLMDMLPMWSDDWEKRDPLRGKHGWKFKDYVNIAVAVGLIAAGLGFFALPIASARDMDCRVHWMNIQRVQQELALSRPELPWLDQTK
jgi:hypothetical protein